MSPALAANCYVVAPGPDGPCVLIDPGYGIADELGQVLAADRLTAAAILLTHGHLDHVAGVVDAVPEPVPVHIHTDDAYRLDNPFQQLGPALQAVVQQQFGGAGAWRRPATVVEHHQGASGSSRPSGEHLDDLAGLQIRAIHAPGHTEGSTLYEIHGRPDTLSGAPEVDRVLFTGDVLFAGSIGRTDLHGGDSQVMNATLREVVLAQPDSALVLPGHGPASTIGRERASNPFLNGTAGHLGV